MTRTTKLITKLVATVFALIALIGFAHTPAGRPLLNALRGAPGCPVNLDGADPAAVEAYRVKQLARVRGSTTARSRPALGFSLGHSTRAQVQATLTQLGASCELIRQGSALRCQKLPAALSGRCAPAIEDLHVQFDPSGVLVAVDLFRAGTTGHDALGFVQARERALQAEVGAATQRAGSHDGAYLDTHTLSRESRSYRYSDYFAEISATNFGARGVRVREQYQWLPANTKASTTPSRGDRS